jgi:copper homeostasis protein CutC
MVAVMSRLEDGSLVPAGPLEIVAGGGLTAEDIMSVQSLTVREAHLADLLETITDCIPPELRPAGLRKQLAAEGSPWLEGKVVVK